MEFQEKTIDILYVEDDVVDAEDAQRLFKKVKESCAIEIASNGQEALNKLLGKAGEKKVKPKVILLDINIPQLNGIDLLRLIRKESSLAFTEVFIVTNAYTSKDKMAIKDLHVRGQIIKPIEYGDALNIYWATQHH